MSQVLNTEERSATFWRFLLFFVITTAVVIVAIFFDYNMPWKENARMKIEIRNQREFAERQEEIEKKLTTVMQLLDSMDKSSGDQDNISLSCRGQAKEIDDLNAIQQASVNGRINQRTATLLIRVLNLKKEIDEKNGELKKKDDMIKEQNDRFQNIKNAQTDASLNK